MSSVYRISSICDVLYYFTYGYPDVIQIVVITFFVFLFFWNYDGVWSD